MKFANEKIIRSIVRSTLIEACWKSHKQVGMKKKGNRQVPNCVPKNEADSSTEPEDEVEVNKKIELTTEEAEEPKIDLKKITKTKK